MSQSSLTGGSVPRPVPTAPSSTVGAEPSLKEVLVELWQNMEKLVRQEVALASAELDLKAQRLKTELVAMAIGAVLLLAGSFTPVAALVLLLDLVMPAWGAALITGGTLAGLGFALVQSKKPRLADVKPERSIRSLEKDLHTFTESRK